MAIQVSCDGVGTWMVCQSREEVGSQEVWDAGLIGVPHRLDRVAWQLRELPPRSLNSTVSQCCPGEKILHEVQLIVQGVSDGEYRLLFKDFIFNNSVTFIMLSWACITMISF